MKYLSFVIICFILISCGSDDSNNNGQTQDCISLGYTIVDGVLEGDLVLRSQEDIDEFNWSCIHTVTGILYINSETPSLNTPISDLSSLATLNQIGGLSVDQNEVLTSLKGLHNITSFYSEGNKQVSIGNNPLLTTLNGLQNLPEVVGKLLILENDNLTSINALEHITHAEAIVIFENNSLINLMGIHNVTFVNTVSVSSNNSLINLIGIPSFNAIQSIQEETLRNISINNNNNLESLEGVSGTLLNGKLSIGGNDSLLTLSHLSDLTSTYRFDLQDNDQLETLEGLESLILVSGPFQIFWNDTLRDFCAISNLATNGEIGNENGIFGTNGNAYNPSLEDIQLGNCSN